METKDQPEIKEEKKSRKGGLFFIIVFQSAAIAVLAWLYWNQTVIVETEIKEKIVYIDKSNSFQAELATLSRIMKTYLLKIRLFSRS